MFLRDDRRTERQTLSPMRRCLRGLGAAAPMEPLSDPNLLSTGYGPDSPLKSFRRLMHKTQVFLQPEGTTTAPE